MNYLVKINLIVALNISWIECCIWWCHLLGSEVLTLRKCSCFLIFSWQNSILVKSTRLQKKEREAGRGEKTLTQNVKFQEDILMAWICTFLCGGVASTVCLSTVSCGRIIQIANLTTNLFFKDLWENHFFFSSSSCSMGSIRQPSSSVYPEECHVWVFWFSGFELYIVMKLKACLPSKLFYCNIMIY